MSQGVQIVIGQGRPPGKRPRWHPDCPFACWMPQYGTIYVNRLKHDNDSVMLRHEATHVAQSCRAGSLSTNAVPLNLPLTNADRQEFENVADFYRREYRGGLNRDLTHEQEAYHTGQHFTIAQVIALVQQECGRLPYLPLSVQARNLTQQAIQRLKAPSETSRNP